VSFPALRAIAYGGGKMPASVIARALEVFPGVDFTNAYGLTETSATICLLTPEDHRLAAASADPAVRRRLGSVGRALPTVELEVRGESGQRLGATEPGFVFVRGAQVAGEYRGAGSLLDGGGWFATQDRGWMDAEGYLFLEGRADDVIVRGGENISPGEIEETLLAHAAVLDAVVVAVPSEQWGEAVAAAVVLKPGAAVTAEALQAWVRERLRSSRVPERLVFRSELPYNEMGKILRRVVRRELENAAGA
jgi:long-chain acyl-CoA synthetase